MEPTSTSTAFDEHSPVTTSTDTSDVRPADAVPPYPPHLETELKFAVTPDLLARLNSSRLVRRASQQNATHHRLRSTYFDTHQHRLRRAGAALRVRQEGDHIEQTVKTPVAGPVGMQNCREWTTSLAAAEPDLSRLDRSALSQLQGGRQELQLAPVFTTVIERSKRVIQFKSARIELAFDSGLITSHGKRTREQTLCELELELLAGDAGHMLEFALKLNDRFSLQPLYVSKAQRGYALARPALRERCAKAESAPLSTEMNTGQSFQTVVAAALRQLQRNVQPVLTGEPGGIHQARVAIRRLRAALRAYKKVLPYDKRKAFNGEFRWFQRRLAPARDWHVFLSETLPLIDSESVDGCDDIATLRRLAGSERRRAITEASKAIGSRRFVRLILQFQRWLLALEQDGNATLKMPLSDFAYSVLNKTRRDFLADGRPLSRMSLRERHTLRKCGKNARYVSEFFAQLWPEQLTGPYLLPLEKLQDQLGAANDATVARLLIASLPPGSLNRTSLLRVQEWSRERELQCLRKGQPVWRDMRSAAPFWVQRPGDTAMA